MMILMKNAFNVLLLVFTFGGALKDDAVKNKVLDLSGEGRCDNGSR